MIRGMLQNQERISAIEVFTCFKPESTSAPTAGRLSDSHASHYGEVISVWRSTSQQGRDPDPRSPSVSLGTSTVDDNVRPQRFIQVAI